jgi:parallel beta-helix repeat protein
MGRDVSTRIARAVVAGYLVAGVGVAAAAPAYAAHGSQRLQGGASGTVLFVAKAHRAPADGHGRWKASTPRPSCGNAQYSAVGAAVAAATPGATIMVCPGTYHEDVIVNKPLTLIGQSATIDAAGQANAVQVVTSHVTVKGFTLTKAIGEGVLVGADSMSDPNGGFIASQGFVLSDVSILDNNVSNDNKGFSGPGGSTSTCAYDGDCGGGIHFSVVSHSTISGNQVARNADGVLLTDDYGPNFANVVSKNVVTHNATDCGITLPSHSSTAVSFNPATMQVTGRNPTMGGVYDNQVLNNVSIDNGTVIASEGPGVTTGSGGGVGIFGSGPGAGAYDNLVQGNYLAGNGLAGVVIHAHHPGGEDVNGNRIIGNLIGKNNIGGDPEDGPPGPADLSTTGVSVYSGVSTVHITIAKNKIFTNRVGIWLNSPVTASGLGSNSFVKVTTPIQHA